MIMPLLMILCYIAYVGIPMMSVPLVFSDPLCVLLAAPLRFACVSGAWSHQIRLIVIPGTRRFVASQIDWISSELSAFVPLATRVLSGTPGTSIR